MSIGAPAALEFKCVQIKHHNASAEVTIRGIQFVSGLVKPNLLDLTHDHRSRRGILGAKGRYRLRPCRTRRRIELRATSRWRQESRNGPAAAVARSARTFRSGITSTRSRLIFRRAGQLSEKFAGRRIVFADRVQSVVGVSDVDKSFAVHRHSMALRRIE